MSARDPDPFDSMDADAEETADWAAQLTARLEAEDEATYPVRPEMTEEEVFLNWKEDAMQRYMERGLKGKESESPSAVSTTTDGPPPLSGFPVPIRWTLRADVPKSA